jgi:hypothetical protein
MLPDADGDLSEGHYQPKENDMKKYQKPQVVGSGSVHPC